MNLDEILRSAWQGITANATRSALTMLGIIIGVGSVITLVAVGTGSSRAVQASINRLGSTTLYVFPNAQAARGPDAIKVRTALGLPEPKRSTFIRPARLTLEDAQALRDPRQAPHVTDVAPLALLQRVTTTFGDRTAAAEDLIGTTPNFFAIDQSGVDEGRLFTDAEVLLHRRVAVVGRTTATQLTGGRPSTLLGQTIQVNVKPFTVIGLLAVKGKSGAGDLDSRIVTPRTALADAMFGYGGAVSGPINAAAVSAASPATVKRAQIEIHRVLNQRHGVSPINPDFTVADAAQALATAEDTDRTMSIMLAAVAGISLLVGGIGVMNIMLVSVTERTREIGVRRALGATDRDIVGQFLSEAVILSMLGGLLGIGAGFLASSYTIAGVEPVIAPYSVYLAFGVSLLTGLFFGLYPASRAAALRPIDALRYE